MRLIERFGRVWRVRRRRVPGSTDPNAFDWKLRIIQGPPIENRELFDLAIQAIIEAILGDRVKVFDTKEEPGK